MPENAKPASEEAPAEQDKDSVLDFLYHDTRRVGSFLAQFDPSGHLTGIRDSESVSKNTKRGWKVSLGGAVAEDIGKGEVALERGPAVGGSEAIERTYDPLWANAREFLDYLDSRSLIQRDLLHARIGQFVLVKGSLLILDLGMLKGAWEKPSVRKLLMSGWEAEKKKLKKLGTPTGTGNEIQFLIDLLAILPHAIQASVLSDQGRAWCCLNESSLVGVSSDLVLKHGAYVPGEWSVLGVLDALPDVKPDPDPTKPPEPSLDELVASLAGTHVGTMSANMAPVARELLGRPRVAWGVTPLLIFREVSGDPPQTPLPDSTAPASG